jgi:hypothetical protein
MLPPAAVQRHSQDFAIVTDALARQYLGGGS